MVYVGVCICHTSPSLQMELKELHVWSFLSSSKHRQADVTLEWNFRLRTPYEPIPELTRSRRRACQQLRTTANAHQNTPLKSQGSPLQSSTHRCCFGIRSRIRDRFLVHTPSQQASHQNKHQEQSTSSSYMEEVQTLDLQSCLENAPVCDCIKL